MSKNAANSPLPHAEPEPLPKMDVMIRSRFSERIRVPFVFVEPSRTKQSFVKECDINGILAQWSKDGVINHVNRYNGSYSDLPDSSDYHESLNHIIAAQEAFTSLPSHIRSMFNNDPGQFLEFASDQANIPQMVEMGLMPKNEPVGVPPIQSGAEGTSSGSAPSQGAKNPSKKDSNPPPSPSSSEG